MWVAVIPCCNPSLLIIPVLGSLVGEWLWCLSAILAVNHAHLLLIREWVAVVPYCNFSPLSMPVLHSLGSEWLWCLAVILACWSYLSMAPQFVGGCSALLQFKPADHAFAWLSRMWVAVVSCCKSSLLTMPVLGSLVCEWLWCLAGILTCWLCLSLALQDVSGCGALLEF